MTGEPKFVRDEATGQSRAIIKTDEEVAAETEAAAAAQAETEAAAAAQAEAKPAKKSKKDE